MMLIPANTIAMVNILAITHNLQVWEDPLEFRLERFLKSQGGVDVDVRGGDLRLALWAGCRVCPGKNLRLVTMTLWVAKLVHHFTLVRDVGHPVGLGKVLKLSCEMKSPLHALAVQRSIGF
jgi:cytochrome P450